MKEENADFIVTNNIETCLKELNKAFKCLNSLKKIDSILENENGYKSFRYIRFVTSLKKVKYELDIDYLFEESNVYHLSTSIIEYLSMNCDELDFEKCSKNFNLKLESEYSIYNSDHEHVFIKWGKTSECSCFGGKTYGYCESTTNRDIIYKCSICHSYSLCDDCFLAVKSEITLNEQKIFILDDILAFLNNILPYSFQLEQHLLHDRKNVKIFLDLLNNKDFVKNSYTFNSEILISILTIINLLSRQISYNNNWKELNTIFTLLDVLNITNKFGQLIYSSIANIIDDEQIESLANLVLTLIQFNLKNVHKFASNLKKEKLVRIKELFRDKTNSIFYHEVMVISCKSGKISVIDCLKSIHRLALNPSIRVEIFMKNNFKKSLKIIIKNGNELEQYYCIKVMAQLAFDCQIMNDLLQDYKFLSMIRKIAIEDNAQLKKLKIITKQLIWLMEEYSYVTNNTNSRKQFDLTEGHIMISYNVLDKQSCIRIKNELEKENNKVWVDLNEINGTNSLDTMAQAIEKSKFILILCSEHYRQSFKCQAEAEYSFKLKKKILPCILDKNYEKIKGWLGRIIENCDFIDFVTRSFDDSFLHLKYQISMFTYNKKQDEQQISIIQTLKSNVNEWSTKDVENWFKQIGLNNSFIFNALFPCTGRLLSQLRQMQVYAPDFFFKSISPKTLNINDLKTIATFSLNLNELFSK